MNKSQLSGLIRECIREILSETGRRICAWCKKDLGPAGGEKSGDTHGICPDCAEKQKKELEKIMAVGKNQPVRTP